MLNTVSLIPGALCSGAVGTGQRRGGAAPDDGDEIGAVASKPVLRVLIVDDEPVGRLALQVILRKLGHQVHGAENGLQALDALRAEQYDCVFMDIQMPEMNGVAATKALRSDPAFRERSGVHVVAMTAYAMEGDRELFLADGMNDFISKPASLADIRDALERFLALR